MHAVSGSVVSCPHCCSVAFPPLWLWLQGPSTLSVYGLTSTLASRRLTELLNSPSLSVVYECVCGDRPTRGELRGGGGTLGRVAHGVDFDRVVGGWGQGGHLEFHSVAGHSLHHRADYTWVTG